MAACKAHPQGNIAVPRNRTFLTYRLLAGMHVDKIALMGTFTGKHKSKYTILFPNAGKALMGITAGKRAHAIIAA